MKKITEQSSLYRHIEKMSTDEILRSINAEDQKVALAVRKVLPDIGRFIDDLVDRLKDGGRLFYIGAGTSGRLGILDASECPPTFGVSPDLVIGLIAGGDGAIRTAVEFAEDNEDGAWEDMLPYKPEASDTVVGLAASGTTPYVVGGLRKAREEGLLTGCITCNPGSPVTEYSDHPLVIEVGPEFITGSTRMKSGTAQKLVLNMITTTAMVKMNRIMDNKMVDMQLANNKLLDRGTRMIMEAMGLPYSEARARLLEFGSVRAAIEELGK
jgi:N-acetylmuramic acid 6-phosphate etherase